MDIDWSMVSAVGTIAGAAATFTATAFALYQSSQASRCKLRCSLSSNPTLKEGHCVLLEAANTGLRAVSIRSLAWTRRSDGARKTKNSAMLFDTYPVTVQPGEAIISKELFVYSFVSDNFFASDKKPLNPFRKILVGLLGPVKMQIVDMAGNRHSVRITRASRKLLKEALRATTGSVAPSAENV